MNRLDNDVRVERSRLTQHDGAPMSTNSFALPFQSGEMINGKYRVQELLGIGGVGFVVSATHIQLDDSVALKVLKPEFASHPEAVRSFRLEARAGFKIKNEHVVRVHDVDVLPSGAPFMVMELLQGQDLRGILEKYRYLSIELAVDVALQACEALAAAHACQIVHRDIKPENLFLMPSADSALVKVLDFGISQALSAAADPAMGAVTSGMISAGTPPYMSPEQIRGSKELDARADLWSLGCVLYELLTGIAPFARVSMMQACAAVLEDEPSPLREGRPEAPSALELAVMRCLSKDPGQRFLNMAELANALAPFGRHSSYCAERCVALLSKDVRRSDPAPVRSEPPRVRRQTINPLSTPVSFAARKPSARSFAAPAPVNTAAATAPLADEQDDSDMSFLPRLRPRKTRWLVLTASASLAICATYLAFIELNVSLPSRMSFQKIAGPVLQALGHEYTNLQRGAADSPAEARVTPSVEAAKPQ